MVAGSLLLASLLLTMGQVPADVAPFNHRNLRIPIAMPPSKRAEISQLILFVSSDQGKSWHQEAVVPPENDEFLFYAPADGMYWLRVAYVNKQGKQEPEDITKGPPNQKVLIDTLKPMVKIASARHEGDEITVAWEIQEEYPDAASLKLEYRAMDAPAGQWLAVPGSPKLIDQARFRPGTAGPVVVRLQIKDLAGNESYDQKEVPGVGGITAASFKANSADSATLSQPPPAPPSFVDVPPPVKPAPIPETEKGAVPQPPSPVPSNDVSSLPGPTPAPSPVWPTPTPTPHEPELKVVARSDDPPAPAPTPNPVTVPHTEPGHSALPAPRLVNSLKDILLEYELKKVGPSGIGSVEVWLTQNDGQSWERYAEDVDAKDLKAGRKYRRTIDLPCEGIYGFCLVVKSRAGRGRPAPAAGELPQIRIEVDTTKPKVDLFEPRADPRQPDSLILQWKVTDRNLADNPITLEYADQLDGKWVEIVRDHSNTSDGYSWKVPTGKVSVYLRLRARDKAGNEGIAVTSQPQLVDLTVPEGNLVDENVSSSR